MNVLSICTRCQSSLSVHVERSFLTLHYTTRRLRSGGHSKNKKPPKFWSPRSYSDEEEDDKHSKPSPSRKFVPRERRIVTKPQLKLSPDDPQAIINYFQTHVDKWSERLDLKERLQVFGVPPEDIQPLLRLFVNAVRSGQLSSPEAYKRYNLVRFGLSSEDDFPDDYVDIVMTGILFDWVANPANQDALQSIPPVTLSTMTKLFNAASVSSPSDIFPRARMLRRKVYMHVGPTNSGKTHNALRALAAAKSGIYAGPLRLLAHEIWSRLNRGEIVPLGAEQDPVKAPPPSLVDVANTDSALDAAPAPSTAHKGNPQYARVCNMITGEEHKIVDINAPLLSCTVEMLSTTASYDVAVIDEIQMIADPDRGTGWTQAVIGLNAKEIHLCGEETAVPIVQKLLEDTNDEVIVKRYERLTPLSMDEALGGDWSKIRKGDCVVCFSRTGIFAVKKLIEEATGMRCAVVYGSLPPEIRSQQAALFNDPNSGYDVLVGSDAIGMGLNLKIRRVVFEKISKFNGVHLQYLSLSQTKQIAGRAGRYGMMQDEKPGGFVTTFDSRDRPFVEGKLAEKPKPLATARLGLLDEQLFRISTSLPINTSLASMFMALIYIGKVPPIYRFSGSNFWKQAADYLDEWAAGSLPLYDRNMFMLAPVPWKQPASLPLIQKLIEGFRDKMCVSLMDLLKGTSLLDDLKSVEKDMASLPVPLSNPDTMSSLEIIHRFIGLYSWLTFRKPIAFSEVDECMELKERVEKALHWTLEGVTKNIAEYHALKRQMMASGTLDEEGGIAFKSHHEMRKQNQKTQVWSTPAAKVAAAQKNARSSLIGVDTDSRTHGQEAL
ncbi:hypothetical protein D9758_001616 [Tetrapyrgos nigripes]|uniref:RNA helicase n=1 Tax=Tetrapyrgos nigripes TaxID=182062 RepID=A0A8H5GXG2_9AGAR|nr:hypothetical protein D9758_001616 [Tetrapyrgos nigripes]